jgi:hypothetical protein
MDLISSSSSSTSSHPPPPTTTTTKTPVTISIQVSKSHPTRLVDVETTISKHLSSVATVYLDGDIDLTQIPKEFIQGVERIIISVQDPSGRAAFFQARITYHAYRLYEGAEDQVAVDEHDGSSTTLFSLRELPNKEYDGLWENLILEVGMKERLLGYAHIGLLFSDHGVRSQTISCNRVVLLHGPPGTGKTSLAQALAHKLSIQMCSKRYVRGSHILEVNAHSLFSRWFSESGKLVQKMFEHIRELASDEESLVFVLIDEVESLTAARNSGGSDPSDAMRVVNALLTQLDRLKDQMNVMIIATSNVTTSVDAAFVDRADVKLYLGPPVLEARYSVLKSCLLELVRAGLVTSSEAELKLLQQHQNTQQLASIMNNNDGNSTGTNIQNNNAMYWLVHAAKESHGLSGRALRKIPVQAFSFHLPLSHCGSSSSFSCNNSDDENEQNNTSLLPDVVLVAKAFVAAIMDENRNREKLTGNVGNTKKN